MVAWAALPCGFKGASLHAAITLSWWARGTLLWQCFLQAITRRLRRLRRHRHHHHHHHQQQQQQFSSKFEDTYTYSIYWKIRTHFGALGYSRLGQFPKVNSWVLLWQNFYRPDALPVTQPTASKHWRMTVFLTRDSTPPPCCQDRSGTLRSLRDCLAPGFKGASLLWQ